MADYSLIMDLDTLIITSKQVGGNKFDCTIFRMTRDSDIDVHKFVFYIHVYSFYSFCYSFIVYKPIFDFYLRVEIHDWSEDERETIQRRKRRKKPRKFY